MLAHHCEEFPDDGWPAWLVQPVRVSHDDYTRVREQVTFMAESRTDSPMMVHPARNGEVDLSCDQDAMDFLMKGFIHDELAWMSIRDVQDGKGVNLDELYPGYREAYHFLRNGVAVADLSMVDTRQGVAIPRELGERHPAVILCANDTTAYVATASERPKGFLDQLSARVPDLRRKRLLHVMAREAHLLRAMTISGAGRRAVVSIPLNRTATVATSLPDCHTINAAKVRDLRLNRPNIPADDLRDHLLVLAIESGASDLHFEAAYGGGVVRLRIDGDLKPVYTCQLPVIRHLISVTKTAIGMNPDMLGTEDRSFAVRVGDTAYKMRASVTPTRYGVHSLVLRVLPKRLPVASVFDLELPHEEVRQLYETIQRPQGLIVVAGPTGSGKTTTLMACLQEINHPTRKILTFENPIEYDVEGLIQSEVNEERGVTFPALMRTALRQDPDVILLGEVRDSESAILAAEASLTGHLVMTTTHTLSATKTLERFAMLDVPNGLLAESLLMLLSQRLVKRINPRNRLAVAADPSEKRLFEQAGLPVPAKVYLPDRDEAGDPIWAGRMPVCEVIPINEQMRGMIRQGSDSSSIRALADEAGMRTIFQNALLNVSEGKTTMAEARKWAGF
jgi:general secretion pathway protein E